MKNMLQGFSMDIYLMEKYTLHPAELLFVKMLCFARESEGREDVVEYFKIDEELRGDGRSLRVMLEGLQKKKVIAKEYVIPGDNDRFYPMDVPFTPSFQKHFSKESLDMGRELYEAYPVSCIVNGVEYKLRRVSKKFDSLEEAFYRYAKDIGFSTEKHEEVLRLVEEGKRRGYQFSTLDSFIVDRDYLNIKAVEENTKVTDNIRML